mgnify:CR=1 FL=1
MTMPTSEYPARSPLGERAKALAPLADSPGGLSGPSGFVMTVAIALALVVLSVAGVNANGAFALLWGSILATRPVDVGLMAAVAAGSSANRNLSRAASRAVS